MTKRQQHQHIPPAGPAREALRNKGQFWTPPWVADAMVTYVLAPGADELFDPAVGQGAFFRAAKRVGVKLGRAIRLSGSELYEQALSEARESGLSDEDLAGVILTDFLQRPPQGQRRAIAANPPYIRHHRLAPELKAYLQRLALTIVGKPLDGRAGLHIYFLLRALTMLAPGGRLAFIMPADTCEGVFAAPLWEWITAHYCLDAVATFSPEATPFPAVDTNPVIFFISDGAQKDRFSWAQCKTPGNEHLQAWVESNFSDCATENAVAFERGIEEGLSTGLSRRPPETDLGRFTLSDFARVMRGIATGDNPYFLFTADRASALGIPREFLLGTVARTRDVPGNEVTAQMLQELDSAGTPTLLFSPDGRPLGDFPAPVAAYLRRGEELGIPKRALTVLRRPWYKMEVRKPPAILFAYLGRRNARFIRNLAGVVPLTGFLCVYPHDQSQESIEALWSVLRHPRTIANLRLVGKSYGSGAIKVEPRSLDRLALPEDLVEEAGLAPARRRLL